MGNPNFVRVEHDGIEGKPLVPATALKNMTKRGWRLVEDKPAKKPAAKKPAAKKTSVTNPVTEKKPDVPRADKEKE